MSWVNDSASDTRRQTCGKGLSPASTDLGKKRKTWKQGSQVEGIGVGFIPENNRCRERSELTGWVGATHTHAIRIVFYMRPVPDCLSSLGMIHLTKLGYVSFSVVISLFSCSC